jgi:hypothetical protein
MKTTIAMKRIPMTKMATTLCKALAKGSSDGYMERKY